jgi:hypothetical protein
MKNGMQPSINRMNKSKKEEGENKAQEMKEGSFE